MLVICCKTRRAHSPRYQLPGPTCFVFCPLGLSMCPSTVCTLVHTEPGGRWLPKYLIRARVLPPNFATISAQLAIDNWILRVECKRRTQTLDNNTKYGNLTVFQNIAEMFDTIEFDIKLGQDINGLDLVPYPYLWEFKNYRNRSFSFRCWENCTQFLRG